MGMSGLPHLLVIVPISVLLTASFFVLFVLRKVEAKGLKAFGYVVAGFLWLSALILFLGVVFNISKDSSKMKYMMQQRMKAACMSQMMQKGGMAGMAMPGMAMPEKNSLRQDRRPSEAPMRSGNRGVISKEE